MNTSNNSGIIFSNENGELVVKRNGKVIISAENIYSIVQDLLAVNCALPEDWPSIRQRFSPENGTYEIAIGAETLSQISKELIDDADYINQLRAGEYFIKTVVNPDEFIGQINEKLSRLGLVAESDFSIKFNRRLGRISVTLCEKH